VAPSHRPSSLQRRRRSRRHRRLPSRSRRPGQWWYSALHWSGGQSGEWISRDRNPRST